MVAYRDGQTDYSSIVVVDDPVGYGVVQIEMLGAHFRTVLEALPLDPSELIDAMVDEALTIDDMDGGLDEYAGNPTESRDSSGPAGYDRTD